MPFRSNPRKPNQSQAEFSFMIHPDQNLQNPLLSFTFPSVRRQGATNALDLFPPRAARERDRRWGAAAAASKPETLRGRTRCLGSRSSGAGRAPATTRTHNRWSPTARPVSASCNFLVTRPHCVVSISTFTVGADVRRLLMFAGAGRCREIEGWVPDV